MSEQKISFEKASNELDKILKQLESSEGTLPLNENVKLFERAKELLEICETQFSTAKGKLTIIKNNLEEFLDKNEF